MNIVYFRHIKQVQFTYIGPYSKLREQISKLKVYMTCDDRLGEPIDCLALIDIIPGHGAHTMSLPNNAVYGKSI